jgi:hypothetical protein
MLKLWPVLSNELVGLAAPQPAKAWRPAWAQKCGLTPGIASAASRPLDIGPEGRKVDAPGLLEHFGLRWSECRAFPAAVHAAQGRQLQREGQDLQSAFADEFALAPLVPDPRQIPPGEFQQRAMNRMRQFRRDVNPGA